MKPDYSEYLKQPGMLAFIEQEWKNNPKMHDEHARIVNEAITKYKLKDIIEVGCGTGQLARKINRMLSYTGIDSNADCIEYASNKNPEDDYIVADIRTFKQKNECDYDLVFCFGFLKHFGLHEWYDIFKKVSSFGEYFIFDMPIAEETKDDGVEFHHVWKSMEELEKNIDDIEFEELEVVGLGEVEPVFICKKKNK